MDVVVTQAASVALPGQRVFQRDAVPADEQRARRLAGLRDCAEARQRIRRPPALHLEGHDGAADMDDEVHLAVLFAQ